MLSPQPAASQKCCNLFFKLFPCAGIPYFSNIGIGVFIFSKKIPLAVEALKDLLCFHAVPSAGAEEAQYVKIFYKILVV